jgi:hypothetical protein
MGKRRKEKYGQTHRGLGLGLSDFEISLFLQISIFRFRI